MTKNDLTDDIVYIDNRETKNRKIKAQKMFKNTEITKLSAGDYCYKYVGIELKRADDFITSVKNRRVFRQAIYMSNTYDIHYIIIYGNIQSAMNNTRYYGTYFGVKSYINAISSLSQVTQVLIVDNETQAFKLMKSLFEKSTDNRNRHTLTPEIKYRNKLISVLMLFGDIGSKRSEKILDDLNIKKFSELLGLKKKDLLSVKGIGEKTSNEIVKWLK